MFPRLLAFLKGPSVLSSRDFAPHYALPHTHYNHCLVLSETGGMCPCCYLFSLYLLPLKELVFKILAQP